VDAPRIPSKLVMQVRFTVHTPPRTSEARARAPRSAARRNSHGAAVRVKITRAERDQLAPAVNAVTSTRAGRSIAGGQRDRLADGANQSLGRGLLFEARDASRLCASQLVRHLPEVYQSKRSCMVRHDGFIFMKACGRFARRNNWSTDTPPSCLHPPEPVTH
jgi:hypothetical protein